MKKCFILSYQKPTEAPPGYEEWMWLNHAKRAVDFLEGYYERNGQLPDLIALEHDITDQQKALTIKRHPNSTYIRYSEMLEESGMYFLNWLMAFCDKYDIDPLLAISGDYDLGNNFLMQDAESWKKKKKHKNVVFRNKWK